MLHSTEHNSKYAIGQVFQRKLRHIKKEAIVKILYTTFCDEAKVLFRRALKVKTKN